MSRIITTALALTILFSSFALASDSTSTGTPKSKRTALFHSLGWTIVPTVTGLVLTSSEHSRGYGAGLTGFGMILGPGTGHVYAHQMRPFLVGTGIRVLIVSSTTLLEAVIVDSGRDKSWDENLGRFVLFVGVAGAGLTLWAASAIYDFSAVGKSVDKYNHSHGLAEVRITPTYFVNRRAPGVMLSVSL